MVIEAINNYLAGRLISYKQGKKGRYYSFMPLALKKIVSDKFHRFSLERIKSSNTHGTGCSLSSALASYLAQKNSLLSSVDLSKNYVWNGIKDSYPIGQGNGPINHFWSRE